MSAILLRSRQRVRFSSPLRRRRGAEPMNQLQFKVARRAAAGGGDDDDDDLSLLRTIQLDLIDPAAPHPLVEVDRIEPDLCSDPIVGDQKVFCHLFQQARWKSQLLAGGYGINQDDERVAVVPAPDSRAVVDAPEL